MCRPRLSKCRIFSDNLFIIVIVSHNFSFVTRSYMLPINCWGCWMTVVAWVAHNCLVFKPNIAPENAHASKNCSVPLICEKYLECEGCHLADCYKRFDGRGEVNAWFAGVCELVGTQNFTKSHVMEVFCFVQHFSLCVYLDGYLLEL